VSKKTIIAICSCALAFLGVLTVATFFDLEINIALGNADSLFGQFFCLFGEATAWIIIPVAGIILYQAITEENKYRKWLKPLWILISLAGFYLLVDYFFDEMVEEMNCEILYVIIFTLALTVLSILGTNKIDKKIMNKLVIFAAFMLVALALSQIVTTILKYAWSRQRFRNMPEGDYSGFSNWYEPNWFNDGNGGTFISDFDGAEDSDAYKSFPSGHTSAAAMSFVLIMLPDLFEKLKKYKLWFYVVPAIYTVAVAISRIVIRAHFLSDVLFGGTIGVGSVFAARAIVYAIKHKIEEKHNTKVQELSEEANI
jgi:membrane-associated phospholipid phosphatase